MKNLQTYLILLIVTTTAIGCGNNNDTNETKESTIRNSKRSKC